jgi:hypothetical protein
MNLKKCYITGCVRNCEKYLDKVFENIKKIGNIFTDYIIIVSYDKSDDNSLNILIEQQKKFKNMIIIINENSLAILRVENISNARNKILDKIRELNNNDFEYLIMIDLDDVSSKDLNISILEKYLSRDDWDSLSFNRKPYYDIWALSYEPHMYSCWHWENEWNIVTEMQKDIQIKLNNLDEDKLFKCYSAFNGLAIYRINKFINCSYDFNILNTIKYIPENLLLNNININKHNGNIIYDSKKQFAIGTSFFFHSIGDCEHRKFHLEAIQKNNARIYISPLYLFYN